MGIFVEINEGLALMGESPLLATVGTIALSVFALHWVRKNAAPRLREQTRARKFGRVLETARGLEELAGMDSLTEEQRASLEAALIDNGEGLSSPEATPAAAPTPEPQARAESEAPPPPWFLDRIEALFDVGGIIFAALILMAFGAGFLVMVYDIGSVLIGIPFSLAGVAAILGRLGIIAREVGLSLTFVDEAKAYIRAKLTPPDWFYTGLVLAGLCAKYVLPVGFFVLMLHWCLANPESADSADWIATVVIGLFAAGTTVKAVQKLRAIVLVPELPPASADASLSS